MKTQDFRYDQAFERNLGWITPKEQDQLRRACVAIAGLGGAGGFQIQALARMGIGRFKIADPDTFELSNINRQVGATMPTLGQSKASVMQEMILAINPEARVDTFKEAVTRENIEAFLDSANLVIDGIDFFEPDAKQLLFQKSYEKRIPALTGCPIGFGASLIVFSPDGMRYEDYFDLREGMSLKEKKRATAFGLSPTPLCLSYMDPGALNLDGKRAASTAPGLMLVGALTASEAAKILTGKYPVRSCPHVFLIDLLTQRVRHKHYRWGMKSPWLRFKKWLIFQWMSARAKKS